MSRIHIGAYWGPRPENLDQCVARLLAFMRLLAAVDPLLSDWHETGWSKKDALKRVVTVTQEGLKALLARRSKGRKVTLGFSFGFWKEDEDNNSCKLEGTCGMSVQAGWNNVKIRLPFETPAEDRFKKLSVLKKLVKIAAQVWEPEWVEVGTDEIVSANLEDVPEGTVEWLPRVGWLTWLPHRPDALPPLPDSVNIEASSGGGVLIIILGEQFSPSRSADIQVVKNVRQALLHAKVLKRVG